VLGAYVLLCAKSVRERPLGGPLGGECAHLTLLLVAFMSAPAIAGDVKAPNPKTILSCLEQQALASTCTKPCITWAQSQPDFRYSLDICVADCRKQNPCVDR
jgi:hypothetical protein